MCVEFLEVPNNLYVILYTSDLNVSEDQGDRFFQLLRQVAEQVHFLSGDGVLKMQLLGMEALAMDTSAMLGLKGGFIAAVYGISQQRMADGGHMHADLVSSARL